MKKFPRSVGFIYLFLSLFIWEKASVQETFEKGRETIWEAIVKTFWQSYSNHNQSDILLPVECGGNSLRLLDSTCVSSPCCRRLSKLSHKTVWRNSNKHPLLLALSPPFNLKLASSSGRLCRLWAAASVAGCCSPQVWRRNSAEPHPCSLRGHR